MLKIVSMELEEAPAPVKPHLPALTGDAYQEALHAVQENSIGLFAIFSRVGPGQYTLSNCNSLFCDLLGFSREELEGFNIEQFFEPRTCTVLKQHLALCLQQAGRLRFEETLYTDTGAHALTGNLVPIADERGRHRGILLMATSHKDENAEASAEQGIAYIEEAFNRLLSSGSNTMVILDSHGVCNYLSSNWKKLTGYEQDECIGRPFLHFVHPEDRQAFRRAAYLAPTGEGPLTPPTEGTPFEFRLLHANGHWHWHESDITVRQNADGVAGVSRFINVSRDITDQKHAQEQLRKAQLAAELASRSRDDFLANMSHELRTPLNAIIGFSDFMRNEMGGPVYNPTYLEYLNDIHDSGHALLEIINNLLDASSIEHGEMQLREEDANLVTLIREAVELQFGQSLRAQVSVRHYLPDHPVIARVDVRKFRQAVSHILSNAIKFTPENGVVTLMAGVDDDENFVVEITDTGLGIPQDKIEQILSPFEMVDASFSKKKGGAGLGLPLAHHFIKMHGGSLSIESALGHGTQVTIELPAYRVAIATHTEAKDAASSASALPEEPKNIFVQPVPALPDAWREAWEQGQAQINAATAQEAPPPEPLMPAEEPRGDIVSPLSEPPQAYAHAHQDAEFLPYECDELPREGVTLDSMQAVWEDAWRSACNENSKTNGHVHATANSFPQERRPRAVEDNPDHPLHDTWLY